MADPVNSLAQGRVLGASPVLRALPAVLFLVAVVLCQKFNRMGGPEGAVLLALLLPLLVLSRDAGPVMAPADPRLTRALPLALGVLLAAQLVYAGARLWHPHVADIATWAFNSGKAIVHGENPYLAPLDPAGRALLGPDFQGSKYLPLMGLPYLPLGLPFGDRGLVATNLILQLGVVALVWRLGRAMGTDTTGRIAACLYMAAPMAILQVLSKVSTDPVAVVPLLLALLWYKSRPGLAGTCVGLSIAAKLTPGALFVPCLLPVGWPARRRYAVGLACGMLPILPYAAWSPVEFFRNIVLFNFIRPSDDSSWLMGMPAAVATAARVAVIAVLLAVAVHVWRRPPALFARCCLCTLLMLAALLLGPSPHQNYHLWWLPFYSAIVAVVVMRKPGTVDRPT